jgi:hypothetical protein
MCFDSDAEHTVNDEPGTCSAFRASSQNEYGMRAYSIAVSMVRPSSERPNVSALRGLTMICALAV